MTVEIEQIALPRIAVADVHDPQDVCATEGERPEEDAREREVAAKASGRSGVELAPPLRTQAPSQSLVER